MKKLISVKIVLIAIITLFATEIYSQGFYITAGAGYGLSPVANAMGIEYNNSNIGNLTNTFDGTNTTTDFSYTYTSDYKKIYGTGSYGKGLQVGVNVGYTFTKNISAELGISYLMGSDLDIDKKFTTEKVFITYIDLTDHSNDSTSLESHSTSFESQSFGQMLRFTPAIKLSMGNGKLKPYIKLGMVLGIITKFNTSSTSTDTFGLDYTQITESVDKYSGNISIGYAGSLGVNYKLSDNFGIFAELGIITQSWTPKKRVTTKYIVDGEDITESLINHDNETEFVDSYTATHSSIDGDTPRQSLKVHYPFSSIALNVGVSYAFGGK